jgi:threonine aldolase
MIDLRSDTVTKPTPGMRAAMAAAEVGDDDFEEDPTVKRLQECAADILGFEAGLFVPSGTQSNLIALLTHCGRGDEYITGQHAHAYRFEGGGAAVLGGIQPQPLAQQPDGSLSLMDISGTIKPAGKHFARTRLLALENTFGGRVLTQAYTLAATHLAHQAGLQCHLDGARIFNAAVKLGAAPRTLTQGFDTVSSCLSKGLGAPAGSVLCGTAAFVREATRWRKMLGGGMRQSGILAAAGLYALENNVDRLAEDHDNASILASGLGELLQVERPQTNIVYVDVPAEICGAMSTHLYRSGVRANVGVRTRLVTHKDVSRADTLKAIEAFKAFFCADTGTH